MDTFNIENVILDFQPYELFSSNNQLYLFDGGNVSLYKIDNTILKILEQKDKTGKDAYNAVREYTDEKSYWNTLYKMKKNGFIKDTKKLYTAEEVPNIKGVTLMLIQACNLACEYCFGAEGEYADRGKMQDKVSIDAIKYLVDNSGETSEINVTFFGGEPLLCFELIRKVVEYCKLQEQKYNKKFSYNMTTNGTLLNDEINEFIIKNKISTMISIDGDHEQQDAKRYYKSGEGCYNEVIEKTKTLREKRYLSARATITSTNMDMRRVFNHLSSLGFNSIPMSPAYNLLSEAEHKQYLIELKNLCEYFYTLIKKNKIEQARKLRILWKALKRVHVGAGQYTACGAGINGVAIDIHGNIYPCHRFVSNKEYILGTIYEGMLKREEYIGKINLENHSNCQNCYLRLLCGGGCSYENYIETGDIKNIFERQCLETKTIYSNIIQIYISLSEDDKRRIFKDKR